jgi:hypothetical protein
MKVRREIASIPVRTAAETWQAVIDLIAGTGSVDVATLKAAASVMESLIADEHATTVPIVVKGSGPRLVIYCLYNESAMEAGKDIDKLNWVPTAGDWAMTALRGRRRFMDEQDAQGARAPDHRARRRQ